MSGRIPRSFIDDLVQRADVVSVVGKRVQLKKAGNSYKACCPFHQEKSPSFHVNPVKQYYHCFGCGVHGNALNFIMEYEHLDFIEAVEALADEMGIPVVRETWQGQPHNRQAEQAVAQIAKQRKATALEVLSQAAQWFIQNLKQHPQGKEAIAYLQQRGVSGTIARDFMIGFALGYKTALQEAFSDVSEETWKEVGLVVEREGQILDKFRSRIIFPIRDLRGQVVAFGGRIIQASEFAPKYLNSPETPYFHKSQTLYGLYELLKHTRQPAYIILVEGYMDVVALAQAGVLNAVATLGTATTEQHITQLFRHTSLIVFAFDGDKAGRAAAQKALALALQQLGGERAVRFFFLPEGEDPDTFVRRVGAQVFEQELMRSALSQGEFLVQSLASTHRLSWRVADDARRLLALSADWVKSCQDVSVTYGLIQAIAQAADMQEWQVERALGIKTGMAVHRKPERTHPMSGSYGDYRREQPTDPPLSSQPSLAQTLLRLLQAFPALADDWPSHDARLIGLLPDEAIKKLLYAVNTPNPVSTPVPHIWIDQQAAQQEWREGWQQLTCQALQYMREESLKRCTSATTDEAMVAQIRRLSQRWREECHKLGKS